MVEGGWLILDKPLQDVQFASTFRCTGGCRAGVMLRTQSTSQGIQGVYVALPEGENPAAEHPAAPFSETARGSKLDSTAMTARISASFSLSVTTKSMSATRAMRNRTMGLPSAPFIGEVPAPSHLLGPEAHQVTRQHRVSQVLRVPARVVVVQIPEQAVIRHQREHLAGEGRVSLRRRDRRQGTGQALRKIVLYVVAVGRVGRA